MDIVKAKIQYQQQKQATKGRVDCNGNTIEFRLSFDEWCEWWNNTGHYKDRGCKKGGYVMSRIGDCGHYEIGNIQCITHTENLQFAQSHPKSKETVNKMSKPKSADHKEKLRSNLDKIRKKRKVITPDGEFESGYECGRHYGITGEAVGWRCGQSTGQFKEWRYAD